MKKRTRVREYAYPSKGPCWANTVSRYANVSSNLPLCCSALQCVSVCCSVLQWKVEHCSVLQCVAVCYYVLLCVAVCCCVLLCVAVYVCACACTRTRAQIGKEASSLPIHLFACIFLWVLFRVIHERYLIIIKVCCSVLQCIAVCCSALQCVAVCRSVSKSMYIYCTCISHTIFTTFLKQKVKW